MKTIIQEIIDGHTEAEIERLKKDIDVKMKQIAELYNYDGNHKIYSNPPVFYVRDGNKRIKL